MRRVSSISVSCLLLAASVTRAVAAQSTVVYTKAWVRGVPAHVVTVNLNSPNVKVSPAVARRGVGSSEGFGSMLSRLRPTAAITGTFFCVRSLVPVGDIVIDGKLVNAGSVGTAVCFASDNTVVFNSAGPSSNSASAGHTAVVCTGPRLVHDGAVYVDPRSEGFRDRALFRRAARTALGITKNNKLLLVVVKQPVYLSKLAHIMRDLGAVNAVNLDGGSSTAMYYKGRVMSHPGRRMTNLLLIYESPEVYAKIKPMLAPLPVVATTSSKS